MVFLRRLGMAMEEKDSVDGLMLEVAEAVAEHWRKCVGLLSGVGRGLDGRGILLH